MITPVDPRTVLMIQKDKEHDLERKIEMLRAARERGAYAEVGAFEQLRAWYAQSAEWLKGKLVGSAARQEVREEPCPVVPC